MSEYQYYEFRAIDRPLTDTQQQELSQYSSRAEITATSFSVEYNWGDFKGHPHQWMEKYFDAFVSVTSWGSRWFMLRIPASVTFHNTVLAYCTGEVSSCTIQDGNLILSIRTEEEGGDWMDGEGWLSSLVALRTDLMKGDLRCFYLAWLCSIYESDVNETEIEPPVPAGLGALSKPLERFADFFGIDCDLIAAAAEQSEDEPQMQPAGPEILAWVRNLPQQEKDSILVRMIEDDAAHPEAFY